MSGCVNVKYVVINWKLDTPIADEAVLVFSVFRDKVSSKACKNRPSIFVTFNGENVVESEIHLI